MKPKRQSPRPPSGGADERKPASSSSQSRKVWVRRESGPERSSECDKEGPRSSSPSVSGKKIPLQTVTPVQPPKSADSPPQMVTPVQSPKSVVYPSQMVIPVQPPKFPDAPLQLGALFERPKSVHSPQQMVTPVQPPEFPDAPLKLGALFERPNSAHSPQQMVTPVQPPKFPDAPLQLGALFERPNSAHSPQQMVAAVQISKSEDSRSTSSGSRAVVSDSVVAPFDICRGDSKCSVGVKPSLLEINREKRRARELSESATALQYLRPGMVLMKNFIKPDDQVKIIRKCRELGAGTGGFYQPGYRDGAKLNLRMMCLGKNWDPESSKYGDIRPFDGAQPPKIPEEFTKFVKDAIEASNAFLKQSGQGTSKPSKEIPLISPDICIVNFYTTAGKLGLHQDKDETEDSRLAKKLPVVSFSLGDTAEFLYGDARDEDKASKVKLESGDVLIFGGQSRHIFHGVSSIIPKTAPTYVTQEANLRPGRLNLTFRQY